MSFDVNDVLGQLTLEEKAQLASGSEFWWTVPVERLGVPKIMVSDGPHGLRAQPDAGDHLGLGGSLPATCYPTASAVASSWNPALLREIGQALGQEARACNLSVILGPGVNMKRSPLCGRNFEYFSEDPFLAGELGVGIVDGIQSMGIGTSLKHYAANNQEDDRLRVSAVVDERTLREIYLPAFERIVTGSQPWTVMCSYNKINGVSSSQNSWLLTTVLRQEWDFQGLVVSDWGAVYDRVAALEAGLDLEMPPAPESPGEVVEAVQAGALEESVLDERVRAVLELVAKGMHVLELDESYDQGAHHALARRAAGESAVLLKNDGGLLPLPRDAKIGVVGEFARTPRFQGAGSSQVNPTKVEIALDEIRALFGTVPFAAGYGIERTDDDDALREEAVKLAGDVDTVVMLMGLPGSEESEGFDRTHMNLPANQIAALEAVAAANPNVVVVLVNGSTVLLGDVTPRARALVEMWLGGQGAGGAIADVCAGVVNPSGRLAETVPVRLQDSSSYLNFPGDSQQVVYGEGLYIGYRGYDKSELDVAFPFGFGLSYTSFEMSDLQVDVRGDAAQGTLAATASVTVRNTGDVAGSHVVQLYVHDVESRTHRPVRELKGFAKVLLEPGQSQRVSIELDQRAFSYWSVRLGRWVVEAGAFDIEVGNHSRDLLLSQRVQVQAPSVAPPLTELSTLQEWVSDEKGRRLIEQAVESGSPDPLHDPETVAVIGTMPMKTLAAFPGTAPDRATLMRMVAERNAAD